MRISFIILVLFLIPICVFGQERVTDNPISPVIKRSLNATGKLQLVTPILLRQSAELSNEDRSIVQNGSKIQSFFSSLILPGLGQATNRTWWKAGFFAAIEVSTVYLFVKKRKNAQVGERNYEKFANRNWSVVQYSNWLIQYHDRNGLDNPHIDDLRQILGGAEATFNVNRDWNLVDIHLLRQVERLTPYITTDQGRTNNFSHVMPEYGSQQYYELISKYYQYQSGWKDYNEFHDTIGHTGTLYNERFVIDREGSYASPLFYDGAKMAEKFNTNYRTSNTFLSLLIANHILSAFDAYFTFRLKQNRVEASSSLIPGQQVQLTYSF